MSRDDRLFSIIEVLAGELEVSGEEGEHGLGTLRVLLEGRLAHYIIDYQSRMSKCINANITDGKIYFFLAIFRKSNGKLHILKPMVHSFSRK